MWERVKGWLGGRSGGGGRAKEYDISPPVPQEDPFKDVRWMEADDPGNPFGVRIVNCLGTAMGLLSTTSDVAVAKRYMELRRSDGRTHIGALPADAAEVECELRYPMGGPPRDGVVHLSQEMEDKWDIYLYDGRLYFARSWTGDLVACADVRFARGEADVTRVFVPREDGPDPRAYAVRLIDFVIKSHIYGWRVPHPLPESLPRDPQQIALYSFGQFGRHGFAGTFEDTLPFRSGGSSPPPSAGPGRPPE